MSFRLSIMNISLAHFLAKLLIVGSVVKKRGVKSLFLSKLYVLKNHKQLNLNDSYQIE